MRSRTGAALFRGSAMDYRFSRLAAPAAFASIVVGCGTADVTDSSSAGLVTIGARIWLTDAVVARLRQRAAAGDPAWVALRAHCDALATGSVEPPSGNAYPDAPDVGQGYQGDGYLPEILALGLCYQTQTTVDDAAASRWAQAGSRVLSAMATPSGSGGEDPSTDDGYGIRNYG